MLEILKPRARTFTLVLLSAWLCGCAAAVVGGSAVAVHDRRSVGTVLDDQTVEIRVMDAIYSSDEIGEESHIKVEVYESVVLLMGETDTEAKQALAEQLASQVRNVDRVVNEIRVVPSASMATRLNNSWLTTKVNTALLAQNPVPGFDPTRIKVVTSDGTVYLMGLVTREEGDAVAEVARNVKGVQRVVKVFNYTD